MQELEYEVEYEEEYEVAYEVNRLRECRLSTREDKYIALTMKCL